MNEVRPEDRLSVEQTQNLIAELRRVKETTPVLEALEGCGVDCQARKLKKEQLEHRIQQILNAFGTNL